MHAEPDVFGLQMVLLLGHNGGCDGEFTEAQLRRGRRVYRRELTDHAERPGGRPGTRPWAWWVFDRGFEDEPDPRGGGCVSGRAWAAHGVGARGAGRQHPTRACSFLGVRQGRSPSGGVSVGVHGYFVRSGSCQLVENQADEPPNWFDRRQAQLPDHARLERSPPRPATLALCSLGETLEAPAQRGAGVGKPKERVRMQSFNSRMVTSLNTFCRR